MWKEALRGVGEELLTCMWGCATVPATGTVSWTASPGFSSHSRFPVRCTPTHPLSTAYDGAREWKTWTEDTLKYGRTERTDVTVGHRMSWLLDQPILLLFSVFIRLHSNPLPSAQSSYSHSVCLVRSLHKAFAHPCSNHQKQEINSYIISALSCNAVNERALWVMLKLVVKVVSSVNVQPKCECVCVCVCGYKISMMGLWLWLQHLWKTNECTLYFNIIKHKTPSH